MTRRLSDWSKPGEMPEWTVGDGGKWLYSDNFEKDACLRLSGNFVDEADQLSYAEMLCARLNLATKSE